MIKKLCFTLALLGVCVLTAQAQEYKSALGARFGSPPISISFKQFISDPGAIEVFAGFRTYSGLGYGWFNVGGLYQHHFPITSVEGLKWYVGGGASAYFWNYDFDLPGDEDRKLNIGLLGNLGLDYKFATAPINLSVDWMPLILLNSYYNSGFGAGYGGLSVRYTLN